MESRVGLPRGTLLDSSYRIERVIGSGGFGITYEAEDTRLGTKVAIKEYYPTEFGQRDRSLSIQPTSERHKPTFNWGRSSFLEEARTLARFRHPSVVQVTRVFEANSTAYMVMIFEEGASFEAWLRNLGRPPTQEELDRIASPLLDALEIMHGQNFLHRDIAPDNIIIRANGTPVLLDFGAARRAVAEMSRALTGIVKTGYSPQEQYTTDGRRQGPWTDLYALGATLYRAVTGRPPEEATLRAMGDHMPSAANAAKGTYRNSFLSAVDACLEVAPTARPQSVAQLRPALFAMERPATVPVQDGRSRVTSVRSRAPIPVRPQARRWPLAVAAILVLLGGVLGGIHYSRWSSGLKLGPVGELGQGAQTEAAAWSAVRDTTSIPALEAFIARFPDSFFADLARVRIAELNKMRADEEAQQRVDTAKRQAEAEALMAWAAVKESTSIAALEAFLKRYPNSSYADLARARLAELRKTNCDGIVVAVGTNEKQCIRPGAGESFKDCPECPEMVIVPTGEFMMGSPGGEAQRGSDEGPQRKVTIAASLAVGKLEVTFAEWDACVIAGGCKYRPEDQGWGRGRRPVINISWDDITQQFLPWLSRTSGKPYRLLTEAEWEYAARAGTATPFSTGTTITTDQANFNGTNTYGTRTAGGRFRERTVEVGSFQPNAFGLYDVHGNVWEWVADCHRESYYGAPTDGTPVTGMPGCSRVVRGGSWLSDPGEIRSAKRRREKPELRLVVNGFRVGRRLD